MRREEATLNTLCGSVDGGGDEEEEPPAFTALGSGRRSRAARRRPWRRPRWGLGCGAKGWGQEEVEEREDEQQRREARTGS